MPVCTKCNENKSKDSFYWERRRARYMAACKDCSNEVAMAWARKNRARVNAAAHRYYAKKVGKDPEDCRAKRFTPEEWKAKELKRSRARYENEKDKISAANKKWYGNNKDKTRVANAKWMAANKERINAWRRDQYRLNPAISIAKQAQRKARKMRAEPPWLSSIEKGQIRELYEIAKARSVQTGLQHDVDHIFPLVNKQFSGLHVPWNLRVMLSTENKKKSTYFPDEFAHMRFHEAR